MPATYYYIDECYREHGDYWHCNIGGAAVALERVVDIEIALEEQIYSLALANGFPYSHGSEFKYSNFFRNTSDEFQLSVARALSTVLSTHDVRFLVSHAKIRKDKLDALYIGQKPSHAIQQLAYVSISHYLSNIVRTQPVQIVVDLGVSESFRPIYDMYAGVLRSIPMMKARGITDSQITIENYRNLPMPLFLDSRDSRILQFSDLLIGLLLSRELKVLTDFKKALLSCLDPVMSNVSVGSVEWNQNAA
jgi:hypothetical protein